MTDRRTFVKTAGVAVAGLAIGMKGYPTSLFSSIDFTSLRPVLKDRKFTSKAVEETIASVKKVIADPELRQLIAGVINRQMKCIQIDPYVNAFNDGPGHSEWLTDETDMKPELHERKYEIDSLCYPVRLSYGYWKTTGDTSVFNENCVKAMKVVSLNQLFIDDANVPSLLALPYMGVFKPNDPLYLNTRRFIFSESNPYFFKGKAADGVGGPHSGMNMIWPLSFTMKTLTSTSDREITACIRTLKATHAGTGFKHESFFKDDASKFTRKWFAWANTLFREMILKVYHERPHLLKQTF
jgi:meiotically up-regulated gene 157 (Mug157) protein